MDYVANDVNRDALSKIHTTTISGFSEIWWFYQSQGAPNDEIDSYVCFDYKENHWSTGKLARTAAADRGALEEVIMVGPQGLVYNHELEAVKVSEPAYVVSGPLELMNGNKNMAVRYVFPDTQSFGDVQMLLRTRPMPTGPQYEHGPFLYENPISTTGVLGREVSMQLDLLSSRSEVGTMRFDVQAVGGGFR
jgi:hypothetical protein